MNINFDGDLRTDSEEEEEEISDVGTVTHAGRMHLSNYAYIFTHRRPELTSWEKASDWFMRCVTRC